MCGSWKVLKNNVHCTKQIRQDFLCEQKIKKKRVSKSGNISLTSSPLVAFRFSTTEPLCRWACVRLDMV